MYKNIRERGQNMKKTIIIVILALVLVAGLTIGGIALLRGEQNDEPPAIDAGLISDRLDRTADDGLAVQDEDVDQLTPANDLEVQRMVGLWYADAGDWALELKDSGTFTAYSDLTEDPVSDVTYYRDIACGYWWSDEHSDLYFALELKAEYSDGEVLTAAVGEVGDAALCLTIDGEQHNMHRSEGVRPCWLEEAPEYCDAVFSFEYTPSRVSAAQLNAEGTLNISTVTRVLSGAYSWHGSSTDYGAAVTLTAADGSRLVENARCVTDDYTYMLRRAGDVISGTASFPAQWQQGGAFVPGVYDVTLSYCGQSLTIEGGLVIE